MSKVYRSDDEPESIRAFEFTDITPETETDPAKEKEPKQPEQAGFVADDYGTSGAEFIPGGFDFDYEGGLRRDEILGKSIDEANAIIENARAEAESIRQKAIAEGEAKGRQQGYEAGLEQAKPVIETFQGLVDQLSNIRGEFYGRAEKEMIDLVISVAHTVIGLEMECDPTLARNVILKAIERLRAREEMTIRIHPDDMAEAEKSVSTLRKMVEDIEKVSFKSDLLIARGGCLVETNIGMIDARLERQLESIRDSFIKALDESEAKGKGGHDGD